MEEPQMKKFKFKVEVTGTVFDTEAQYALLRVQHGISIAAGIMNGPTETKVSIMEESGIIKPNGNHGINIRSGK